MATAKMSLAQEFIDRYGTADGPRAFADGLMAGDAARFKAGYTADNAYLATLDAFELSDNEKRTLIQGISVSPATVARREAANLGLEGEEYGEYVEDAVAAAEAASLDGELPDGE